MKKLLSLILCAVLALALCLPAAAYSDVSPEAWYAEAVAYCELHGLMDGVGGGAFAPDAAVTRAQLVTVLWRMAGKPVAHGAERFSDVPENVWYTDAVRWASGAGVTTGTGGGLFSPDAAVSREMLATFFHRFAGLPAAAGEAFTDQDAISAWAQTATRWAAGSGLMQGVGGGRFDPKTVASRAALAQTLMNYDARAGAITDVELRYAPVWAARDEEGAIWITDSFNKAVWRIADGVFVRAAGAETVPDINGSPMGGYADGAATSSLFASPWAIAPFLDGWAISDPENNVVRVLQEDVVWTANISGYDYPTGLAADGNGNLFVANTHAGEILLVSPTGKVSKAAEGLDNPMGLCYLDGVLYIAETGARRILMLENGAVTVLAGSGAEGSTDGPAAEASFVSPQGVAVGADGSIYVADTVGASVRCIRNGVVTTLLTQTEDPASERYIVSPTGLLLDGAQLLICDPFARKIVRIPTV